MKWGPMNDEPPRREEEFVGSCRRGAVEKKHDVLLIADLVDQLAAKHPRDGVHIWVCQCEFARMWRALVRLQEVGLGTSLKDLAAARKERQQLFGIDCE